MINSTRICDSCKSTITAGEEYYVLQKEKDKVKKRKTVPTVSVDGNILVAGFGATTNATTNWEYTHNTGHSVFGPNNDKKDEDNEAEICEVCYKTKLGL